MLLNKKIGCYNFLVLDVTISCCTCFAESGAKATFHWIAQLLITIKSLLKVDALVLILVTLKKRQVSSAKAYS